MKSFLLKSNSSFYFFLFIFFFSFSSCLTPGKSFEKGKVSPPPDYSQEKYWAALPTKKDSADAVPYSSGLIDGQANAKVDVFFIYPTILYYR